MCGNLTHNCLPTGRATKRVAPLARQGLGGTRCGQERKSMLVKARLGGGCQWPAELQMCSCRQSLPQVYPVRCGGRQLLETWLSKDKSSEERGWLTPVTCGPLGMLYTARLGSSQQTSECSLDFLESQAEFQGLASHSEAGKLRSSEEVPTPNVP